MDSLFSRILNYARLTACWRPSAIQRGPVVPETRGKKLTLVVRNPKVCYDKRRKLRAVIDSLRGPRHTGSCTTPSIGEPMAFIEHFSWILGAPCLPHKHSTLHPGVCEAPPTPFHSPVYKLIGSLLCMQAACWGPVRSGQCY
jgi:hypothetical protein